MQQHIFRIARSVTNQYLTIVLASCLLTSSMACAHDVADTHETNTATGILTMNLNQVTLATLNGGNNAEGKRFLFVEDFFDQRYNNQAITDAKPDPIL